MKNIFPNVKKHPSERESFFPERESFFPERGKEFSGKREHFPERAMEMPHGIRTHRETPSRERRAYIRGFARYHPNFCVLYGRVFCNTY